MAKDYYEILNVSPNAEQEQIDLAYRRLAEKYHPAHNSSAKAARRMREINEAWRVLGDPYQRAQYDRSLYLKTSYEPPPPDNLESTALPRASIDSRRPMAAPWRERRRASRARGRTILALGAALVILLGIVALLWNVQNEFVWIFGLLLLVGVLIFFFSRLPLRGQVLLLGLVVLVLGGAAAAGFGAPLLNKFRINSNNAVTVSTDAEAGDPVVVVTPRPTTVPTPAKGCPTDCPTLTPTNTVPPPTPTRTRASPNKNVVKAVPTEVVVVAPIVVPSETPFLGPPPTPTSIYPYPAPVLKDPPDRSILKKNTILRWASPHSLGADEVFEVVIWKGIGTNETSFAQTRALTFPIDFRTWGNPIGTYQWSIRIKRLDGSTMSETMGAWTFNLTDE